MLQRNVSLTILGDYRPLDVHLLGRSLVLALPTLVQIRELLERLAQLQSASAVIVVDHRHSIIGGKVKDMFRRGYV